VETLTNEEVGVWMQDPTTKKVFERIRFVESDSVEMLVQGVPNYDYTTGFIHGLRFIFSIGGDEADGNRE